MATEIASLFARIGADTTGFTRGLNSVHGGLTGMRSPLNALGGLITTTFKVGAGLVAGFGAAMIGATVKAAGMEQSLADTAAAMNLTAEETAQVKDLIKDLSLDPTLKVNSQEAAAAIDMLGRNGLELSDIMGGAARSTVLLANATGADMAQAADIATSAMQAFNLNAGDLDGIMSNISGSLVASKFGIDDYGLALAQAGGVAGAFGVTIEDFNASIAAISPLFQSGSDAGTSFKTLLQRLVPVSGPAADAMAELGLITEDGTNKFFDATGKMKSMGEIAGVLQTALAGLSDEQKIAALTTAFGTDAQRAAIAMANIGQASFANLKATIGKTDAEEQAKRRMDTLAGSWDIFRGIIDANVIALGEKFLPVARRLIDWASEWLTKHQPKIDAAFETFGVFLNDLADGFTGANTAGTTFANQLGNVIREQFAKIGEFLGKTALSLDGLSDWFNRNKTNIVDGAGRIADSFMKIAGAIQKIAEFWEKLRGFDAWASRYLNAAGGPNDFFNRLFGRAGGGPASGMTLVGERGPELVNLPVGSYVNSNAASQNMTRGGTQITIQNLNMQGTGNSGADLTSTVTFLNSMWGYGY